MKTVVQPSQKRKGVRLRKSTKRKIQGKGQRAARSWNESHRTDECKEGTKDTSGQWWISGFQCLTQRASKATGLSAKSTLSRLHRLTYLLHPVTLILRNYWHFKS